LTLVAKALTVACLGAGLTCACGGGGKAPEDKPAPAAQQDAAPAQAAAVADGDFGVAECDQYIRKYLACVDGKVPEAARPMMRQSLDQTKAAWKQAAATPQGKTGLAAACTQADANSKQAMQAYGCEW
jgi:hypothetical protein